VPSHRNACAVESPCHSSKSSRVKPDKVVLSRLSNSALNDPSLTVEVVAFTTSFLPCQQRLRNERADLPACATNDGVEWPDGRAVHRGRDVAALPEAVSRIALETFPWLKTGPLSHGKVGSMSGLLASGTVDYRRHAMQFWSATLVSIIIIRQLGRDIDAGSFPQIHVEPSENQVGEQGHSPDVPPAMWSEADALVFATSEGRRYGLALPPCAT
jgi:hypothetical protein